MPIDTDSAILNIALEPTPQTAGGLMLQVHKTLASGFALDASFAVPPGITIVFGRSGSGKTTLLDCIAGLTVPDAGSIIADGCTLLDSGRGIDMPAAQRKIGYVFQDLALFPHLTAGANVEYGLSRLRPAERRARSQAILESFRIAHLRSRRPREISGGERQRVALARALVIDPTILLLDEPLSGLDAPTRSHLFDDLRAWNEAHRIPVLYVTHNREEVFALGERVIVLEHGKVLAQGSPSDVLDSPRSEIIADLSGIENRFSGEVLAIHPDEGTMTCRVWDEARDGAVQLEAPLGHLQAGASVLLGIRAGDILLATAAPRGLSARNILAGRIVAMERRDVMVIAEVDCGARFIVHLTPAAEKDLELHAGREVWLVIKTHSCHLLQQSAFSR
ncbi:MAG: molybdenum ABC transporter ATP-binding protein [Terriglobales bacterium]